MWMRRFVRDLLDTLTNTGPFAGEGLSRTLGEIPSLVGALFRPVAGDAGQRPRDDFARGDMHLV